MVITLKNENITFKTASFLVSACLFAYFLGSAFKTTWHRTTNNNYNNENSFSAIANDSSVIAQSNQEPDTTQEIKQTTAKSKLGLNISPISKTLQN